MRSTRGTSQSTHTQGTHRGLFQYQRLPFGVTSAPAIFQQLMESPLQGLPGVCICLDDILVTGTFGEEHLQNLSKVLQWLKTAGLRLKKEKCVFLLPRVDYLGYRITSNGLESAASKVVAILTAPAPRNLTELRCLLGMVNYNRTFLPAVATILAPLQRLLLKGSKWQWGCEQQEALAQVKSLLVAISQPTCSFRWEEATDVGTRCVTIRCGGCTITSDSGWLRETHHICL